MYAQGTGYCYIASCRSTDGERPHRYCYLANNIYFIDRTAA